MTEEPRRSARYITNFFETTSVDSAKNLILSDNHLMDTKQRWEAETPFVGDMIIEELGLTENSTVLDYGSGLGRLAKHLITRIGCRVIGVDISSSMRRMSVEYVGSTRFTAASFDEFDALVQDGTVVDGAYAVWVLQHSAVPAADIIRIKQALRPEGRCYLLNARGRCVPCDIGWVNDGINIFQQMHEHGFHELKQGTFDFYGNDDDSSEIAIVATYEKNPRLPAS
jgi:SAM-dependent methyltransferase